MTGINLHGVVRGAIETLHPSVAATLYRNTGQRTDASGRIRAAYAEGESVAVQMRSEGATSLFHTDKVGQEEVTRKLYLCSASGPRTRVAGIVRPLSRGGDMLQMADGTWWLVEGTLEDFSRSGWVCVRATLQVRGPDFG